LLGAAVGFSGRAAPNADNKKFWLNFTEINEPENIPARVFQ
jgi:hypothetical protein